MPEDTVNYKVNIDASDVATQLEQIRAQVDASMGAMSMASASMPVGFNSPVSASAPMMELNPYNTINALSSSFANQAFSTGISESQGLGAFIQGTSEAFNLGYGKFSNGVRQMGLMAEMPPLISHPTGGLDTFTLNMEAIQHAPMFTASGQRGHPGSIAGSLGIGFDKMGPLTYQESVDASRQNLASQIGKLSSAWVGTAVGAAAGSIVPGGTIGGMAVGFGYDMATSIGGARIKQANAVGAGLQQIASHSLLGTLGKDQSRTMARGLLDMADSSYGIQTGLDRTEIQDNLLGFASSGGYENVRTAEEFEKVSKDVIMNTRKVMTTLRTTQAEALKLMADLQREGLVDAGDMGNFSANMSGLSQVTGMDSGRVLNFVRQGAEMFRGSSLGMGGGMNIMEQALQDTRDMMKSSDVSRGIIRELGGVDAATIGRTESNVNFMNSTLGLMSYNNWQAGGATGNRRDIVDNLGGRDIFDVYKLQVQRDRDIASGDYSQQRISRDRIMTDGNLKGYVDAWERTNEGSFFEDPTNLAS
ncbi:MAG: hypothetical protein H8E12_14780 [Rhodobacteraceae bacterium]|nr:hypothetical protein [Paracoccaceae bacterium]